MARPLDSRPDVFAHACRLGAEGIVSKRLGSAYNSGLCRAWVKVKNPGRKRDRAEELRPCALAGRVSDIPLRRRAHRRARREGRGVARRGWKYAWSRPSGAATTGQIGRVCGSCSLSIGETWQSPCEPRSDGTVEIIGSAP
jgi:hypothetical protein